jgi:hypothetical protein
MAVPNGEQALNATTSRSNPVPRHRVFFGGAPGTRAFLRVQVPPQVDHSERRQAQLREGDRLWKVSSANLRADQLELHRRRCQPGQAGHLPRSSREQGEVAADAAVVPPMSGFLPGESLPFSCREDVTAGSRSPQRSWQWEPRPLGSQGRRDAIAWSRQHSNFGR